MEFEFFKKQYNSKKDVGLRYKSQSGLLGSYGNEGTGISRGMGTDQWNRIQTSEIDPQKYAQLIFDKDSKAIRCTKNNFFNKGCWTSWTFTGKENESWPKAHIFYSKLTQNRS